MDNVALYYSFSISIKKSVRLGGILVERFFMEHAILARCTKIWNFSRKNAMIRKKCFNFAHRSIRHLSLHATFFF
jgi:hypothetical protein